jgi:dolichol-phosphate mannosyltransferase
MDADLSHQPKYIPQIIEALKTNDLVIGSRYITGGGTKNWSLRRRMLSRYGNLYAKTILNVPINDLTAGYVGINAKVLEKIDLDIINGIGYAFQKEIKYRLYKAGAKTIEIPIIFQERRAGKSKISGNIIKEGLIMPWKIRLNK